MPSTAMQQQIKHSLRIWVLRAALKIKQSAHFHDKRLSKQGCRRVRRRVLLVVVHHEQPGPAPVQQRKSDVRRKRRGLTVVLQKSLQARHLREGIAYLHRYQIVGEIAERQPYFIAVPPHRGGESRPDARPIGRGPSEERREGK